MGEVDRTRNVRLRSAARRSAVAREIVGAGSQVACVGKVGGLAVRALLDALTLASRTNIDQKTSQNAVPDPVPRA